MRADRRRSGGDSRDGKIGASAHWVPRGPPLKILPLKGAQPGDLQRLGASCMHSLHLIYSFFLPGVMACLCCKHSLSREPSSRLGLSVALKKHS